mmetsp:Transcript_2475/g.7246  ORF Transcript_2475/g.7246 Transcript_2475/m.7246 type:complete len:468 (-) Transcript_2475:1061-2464(-)
MLLLGVVLWMLRMLWVVRCVLAHWRPAAVGASPWDSIGCRRRRSSALARVGRISRATVGVGRAARGATAWKLRAAGVEGPTRHAGHAVHAGHAMHAVHARHAVHSSGRLRWACPWKRWGATADFRRSDPADFLLSHLLVLLPPRYVFVGAKLKQILDHESNPRGDGPVLGQIYEALQIGFDESELKPVLGVRLEFLPNGFHEFAHGFDVLFVEGVALCILDDSHDGLAVFVGHEGFVFVLAGDGKKFLDAEVHDAVLKHVLLVELTDEADVAKHAFLGLDHIDLEVGLELLFLSLGHVRRVCRLVLLLNLGVNVPLLEVVAALVQKDALERRVALTCLHGALRSIEGPSPDPVVAQRGRVEGLNGQVELPRLGCIEDLDEIVAMFEQFGELDRLSRLPGHHFNALLDGTHKVQALLLLSVGPHEFLVVRGHVSEPEKLFRFRVLEHVDDAPLLHVRVQVHAQLGVEL